MENKTLEPYKKGFLDAGDGHQLYFELCGNPQGKPILYLHGGPGAGFSENSKKYFDPSLWNIILFDQRGAGRSTPFASLNHNTTDYLVNDINTLLNHINIQKVTLFGGSWGSTLALVYAIRNKDRVNGMIVRGIFLGNKSDNEYYFGGKVQTYFPEVWERFINLVPQDLQTNPASFYFEKMKHGTPQEKEYFSYEWAYYESSLLHLRLTPRKIEEDLHEFSYQSLAPLEAHYLLNNCFLPENYILDHAAELSYIPTYIIHGRYDMVCQPFNAYLLHQKIKNSRLYFPIAGHSGDTLLRQKLQWALKKIYLMV